MLKVKVNQLKEKLELEPTETEEEEEEEESEISTPTTGTEVDPEIPEEVKPTSESSSTEGVMGEEPKEEIGFREKVRRKFGRLSRLFKLKRRLMSKGK